MIVIWVSSLKPINSIKIKFKIKGVIHPVDFMHEFFVTIMVD